MATKRISELLAAETLDGSELIEVSQLSATVQIAATTISADASDNSFNDSGNDFISAGFAVGDRVRVTGFASSVNNFLSASIITLTAAKMIIGGTEGPLIETESAGGSVVITKWVSRRALSQDVGNLGGGGGGSAPVQTEASNYTVDPSDEGNYIRLTAAGAKTVTVNPESTTALPNNGEWHFRNVGAGDATITPGLGVTINAPQGGTLVVPTGGTVTLKRAAANIFDLMGQVVPV